MSEIKKIVLIGAGNVATQMGIAFKQAGFTISQVYSKTEISAKTLAKKLNCKFTSSPKQIIPNADIYIIAIKDDAIADISKKIKLKNKIVVHTSGSAEMNVLKKISKFYGVLYPLQTFSKNRKINFKEIPFCIEANDAPTEKIISAFAKNISGKMYKINSRQRAYIHLAAVFANNFSNHLFAVAEKIITKHGMKFSLLHPLIQETVLKAMGSAPSKTQTGPAMRADKKIISKHLAMLKNDKENRKLYKLISKSIANKK